MTKAKPSHPSYEDMIKEAIVSLKDRMGSSRPALKKFLAEKYKIEETPSNLSHFNAALKRGSEKGVFKFPKGPSGRVKLGEVGKKSSITKDEDDDEDEEDEESEEEEPPPRKRTSKTKKVSAPVAPTSKKGATTRKATSKAKASTKKAAPTSKKVASKVTKKVEPKMAASPSKRTSTGRTRSSSRK